MKDIEFHKRLAGAIKSLEVYTDKLTIDTAQADLLMQEIARCRKHLTPAEYPLTHKMREEDFAPENNSQQTGTTHLPDYLQEVFVLYISGYKFHEIAELLNIPTGTVKSRIYAVEKGVRENTKGIKNH